MNEGWNIIVSSFSKGTLNYQIIMLIHANAMWEVMHYK